MAVTNRFIFMLGGYPAILGGGGSFQRQMQSKYSLKGPDFLKSLRYLCETADIPGLTIHTDQRKGYSPQASTQMPGRMEYGQFQATFIARDHMSEKEFFDDWLFMIKNAPDHGAGPTYDNAYMSDIVVDASLLVLSVYNNADATEESKNIRYAICFRDLYPVSIDPINLNWHSEEFMKFNITFAYSYWEPIVGLAAYSNQEPIYSHSQEPGKRLPNLNESPVSNGLSTPNAYRNTPTFPR